jgi:hypothetical protein
MAKKRVRIKKTVRRVVVRGGKAKPKPKKAPLPATVQPEALPPNKQLLVIEDSTIKMMLVDPRFTNAVPCLQAGRAELKGISKKCGRCSRQRTTLRRKAFNKVRRCLASLNGSQRGQVKKLLGVKNVRVILQGGKQHVTY